MAEPAPGTRFSVFTSDPRAGAFYLKLGFVEEGRETAIQQIDGVFHDEALVAIVRE